MTFARRFTRLSVATLTLLVMLIALASLARAGEPGPKTPPAGVVHGFTVDDCEVISPPTIITGNADCTGVMKAWPSGDEFYNVDCNCPSCPPCDHLCLQECMTTVKCQNGAGASVVGEEDMDHASPTRDALILHVDCGESDEVEMLRARVAELQARLDARPTPVVFEEIVHEGKRNRLVGILGWLDEQAQGPSRFSPSGTFRGYGPSADDYRLHGAALYLRDVGARGVVGGGLLCAEGEACAPVGTGGVRW